MAGNWCVICENFVDVSTMQFIRSSKVRNDHGGRAIYLDHETGLAHIVSKKCRNRSRSPR
jgi:hypothetical protein